MNPYGVEVPVEIKQDLVEAPVSTIAEVTPVNEKKVLQEITPELIEKAKVALANLQYSTSGAKQFLEELIG